MDGRMNKAPTVEELLQFVNGVDFELRNIACGMLFELQEAEKELAADHPARPLIARARHNAEALVSWETKLHFRLREILPPKPA